MANNNFPDLIVPPKDQIASWGKQIVQAAVETCFTNSNKEKTLDSLYRSYNGTTDAKEFKYVESAYGIESRNKMIHYRSARSKMKMIENEFLKLGFDATVSTINREAIAAKKRTRDMVRNLSRAKPFLEKLPEKGIKPFEGMPIPDENDPKVKKKLNDKTNNEAIMQYIVDKKTQKEGLRKKFSKNIVDVICSCEAFTKVERSTDGTNTIRVISPWDAIYLEDSDDDMLKKTPIKGERRKMYQNDVMLEYAKELEGNEDLSTKVKNYFRGEDDEGNYYNSDRESLNGMYVGNVYTVEAKVIRIQYAKTEESKDTGEPIESRLSLDEYLDNKKQYEYKEKSGKCKIEKIEKEDLYEFHMLGKDILLRAQRCEDIIYSANAISGKKKVESNYCGLLSGTVKGVRVPLQALIHNLDAAYDIIMFQLMREINKIKGKVMIYDEAFLPKGKNINQVLNDIIENNIIIVNSAQDGIGDANDAEKLLQQMREIDIGASETLNALILAKQDIENSIDRITGINEARQGIASASSKVGNNQMNLEASRSITYDIFYNMNEFIEENLMKLVEKTKISFLNLEEDSSMLLGDDQIGFLRVTRNIAQDSFATYISDGRREMEVKERIRSLYDVQVNSGELRASDVAKAEMQETFVEFIGTLENAWETIQNTRQKQTMEVEQEKTKQLEIQSNMASEEREDNQSHEKDIVQLQGEINKEIQLLKQSFVQAGIVSKEKLANEREKIKARNEQVTNPDQQTNPLQTPNFA